jgi:hypothetical protein
MRLSLRRVAPVLLFILSACALPPQRPVESVVLPPSASGGITDPTRGAIFSSAYVFGQPATVAGNPAAAAEAIGQLEYLTVEIPTGPRWQDLDALVTPMLAMGRDEARAAMGVRPGVPAQAAVDAFYGAAAALRGGNRDAARSALAPVTADPGATLAQLDALPYLPRAAAGTRAAQTALSQRDSGRDRPFDD